MFRQVTFLDPGDETNRNADGSFPEPSVFLADVPAAVVALSGRELYKAQQIVGEVTHQVTVRGPTVGIPAIANLLTRMLATWTPPGGNPKTCQIQAIIDPDERGFEYRILCVERNQGQQ